MWTTPDPETSSFRSGGWNVPTTAWRNGRANRTALHEPPIAEEVAMTSRRARLVRTVLVLAALLAVLPTTVWAQGQIRSRPWIGAGPDV